MTTVVENEGNARSRRRRPLVWIAIALAPPLFLLLWNFPGRARSDLEEQVRLARAEGLPTTFAEVAAAARVPDSENAAQFYEPAERAFRASDQFVTVRRFDRFEHTRVLRPHDAALAEQQWAADHQAVELFFKGAALPHCDFKDEPGEHMGLMHRAHTSFLLAFVKLASLQARALSSRGLDQDGLALLARLGNVTRHVLEMPSMLSAYDAKSLQRIIDETAFGILREHHMRTGVPEAAAAIASATEFEPNLANLLGANNVDSLAQMTPARIREYVKGIRYWESRPGGRLVPSNRPRGPDETGLSAATWLPGALDAWKVACWKRVRRETAATRVPGATYAGLMLDCDREGKREQAGLISGARARLQSPSDGGLIFELLLLAEDRRLLAVAAIVFEEWNRTGSIPKQLPPGGLAIKDPLDNRRFKYTRTARGFEIDGSAVELPQVHHIASAPVPLDRFYFTEPTPRAKPLKPTGHPKG